MAEKEQKLEIRKIDLFHRIVDANTGKPALTHLGNPVDGGGHHSLQKAERQLGYITAKASKK